MIISAASLSRCSSAFFLSASQVDVPVHVGGDDDDAVAGHHRTRGIGAVRRGGDQDDVAMALISALVIGADHREPGKLALRTRVGLE